MYAQSSHCHSFSSRWVHTSLFVDISFSASSIPFLTDRETPPRKTLWQHTRSQKAQGNRETGMQRISKEKPTNLSLSTYVHNPLALGPTLSHLCRWSPFFFCVLYPWDLHHNTLPFLGSHCVTMICFVAFRLRVFCLHLLVRFAPILDPRSLHSFSLLLDSLFFPPFFSPSFPPRSLRVCQRGGTIVHWLCLFFFPPPSRNWSKGNTSFLWGFPFEENPNHLTHFFSLFLVAHNKQQPSVSTCFRII